MIIAAPVKAYFEILMEAGANLYCNHPIIDPFV